MAWKPDKAPGRKREQKQRLARQQKRKDFAKNMERAEAIAQVWHKATYEKAVLITDLDGKFIDWALSRHRDLMGEEMSQKHKNMSDQWREILVTAKTCAKATSMRKTKQHIKKHSRKVDAFLEDCKQRRAEAAKHETPQQRLEYEEAQRAVAEFHAKMQERAMR